jgi:hypothetical protein
LTNEYLCDIISLSNQNTFGGSIMKKTLCIIAFLDKPAKIAIVALVAIISTVINTQAQELSYINEAIGVSYLIPDNFTKAKSSTKNSLLRLRSIEEQNQVREIKLAFIRFNIPENATSWDDGLLATLKEANNSQQLKPLYKTSSCNKHIVSTKEGEKRCIKITRKSNVLQTLSEMEYVFVLKEGIFTVTIFIEETPDQIHNYEKYINNLTVESK